MFFFRNNLGRPSRFVITRAPGIGSRSTVRCGVWSTPRHSALHRHDQRQGHTMDTVLSLDLGPDDSLYRIRRSSGGVNRVVYVTLNDPDIIPNKDFKRTYGPSVIKELSKLTEWSGNFTTLTVHKDGDHIWCETDTFRPHALPKEHLLERYHDIFSLDSTRIKNRVSRVALDDGRTCYLKIAHFPHHLPFLKQELQVYHHLADKNPTLVPKLLGYVYEESPDRVVGFLVEGVEGRIADITDLDVCTKALDELHRFLIHGDLCKYNIFITSEGPKFIDFEVSTLISGLAAEDAENMKSDERQTLRDKLIDESGDGRPLDYDSP